MKEVTDTQALEAARRHRQRTWFYFLAIALLGYWLEQEQHEMHVSKVLMIGSLGVWAREQAGVGRILLLTLVGISCVLILGSWYQFRNQHLVPLGHGAYRIENK